METAEIVVGLDIGTTKIAAIVGSRNEYGKIEILGIGKSESIGVTRGVVANIEKTVQSMKMAVEEAEQKSGVNIRVVNVGIAGQHIKSIQHRGNIMRNTLEDEITQQDIDVLVENMYKLVMQPGEEIIHVIPQEYIVDKEPGIKDPIGMSGICLEANFHIITGQVAAAKNIHKCVSKAGLEVAELILEPLAPFGGNVITEDIKEGCTIIRSQAEALKIKFGSALASENKDEEIVSIPGLRGRDPREISLKNLASIIQARMEEIIEHIYYEIKNSGYEKKLIAGIVLTGGGAQLKHVAQLTEFITGMDTRIGYPNEHLAKNVSEEIASPMFATGVGLVIKGFERLEKTENKDKVMEKANDKKKIQTHSKKTKGSFFDKIFAKGKEFFEDGGTN
jgi:cell division protein FtsA